MLFEESSDRNEISVALAVGEEGEVRQVNLLSVGPVERLRGEVVHVRNVLISEEFAFNISKADLINGH